MSSLFGGGGGLPSLTDSIFGQQSSSSDASPASKSNSTINDLFGKPPIHRPAPKRPRINRSQTKQKKPKPPQEIQEKKRKSRKEILARRRTQSQSKIAEQLTISLKDYTNGSTNYDELYGDARGIIKHHGLVIIRNALSPEEITDITALANATQERIVGTLDEKDIPYDSERNNEESFVFEELAVRCRGRMDVRYCDGTLSSSSTTTTSTKRDNSTTKGGGGGKGRQKLQQQGKQTPKSLPALGLIDDLAASILHGAEPPNRTYAGWIFSYPNSDDQPWHTDGSPLFDKGTEMLPGYALNVFCGLHGSDDGGSGSSGDGKSSKDGNNSSGSDDDDQLLLELGPTEFVVGSHHMAPENAMEKIPNTTSATATNDENDNDDGGDVVSAVLGRGDILLYDYRICHRGTSNITTTGGKKNKKKKKKKSDDGNGGGGGGGGGIVRKVLYLMYARPWFREHLNFGDKSLFE